MTNLTASLENYLEAILSIYDEQQTIKANAIAKRLSVSKASVTEALRALRDKGFINYAPYENITLTPTGVDRAQKISQKHEVLFSFLNTILGIEEKEALDTACKIEHVISENVLDKFVAFIEFNEAYCQKKYNCKEKFSEFYKKMQNNT